MIDFFDKYNMSLEKEKKLWKEAVFIFDTNALLNFYRYPVENANDIFTNVFKKLENRLWIPAHVLFEFNKHKEERRNEPIETYTEFKRTSIDKIGELLNNISSRIKRDELHPKLKSEGLEELKKAYEVFNGNVKKEIGEIQKKIKKTSQEDIVLDNIKAYFLIGDDYDYNKLIRIVEEGEFRYKNEIPPGYLDEDGKSGFQKYGDLIIWKQILDYSKKNRKSVVLITDDNKEDWWDKELDKEGKIPRYELIKEIESFSHVVFWMYSLKDFIDKAESLLEVGVSEATKELVNTHDKKKTRLSSSDSYRASRIAALYDFEDFLSRTQKGPFKIDKSINEEDISAEFIVSNHEEGVSRYFVEYLPTINYFNSHAIRFYREIKDFHPSEKEKIYVVFLFNNYSGPTRVLNDIKSKRKYPIIQEIEDSGINILFGFVDNGNFVHFYG